MTKAIFSSFSKNLLFFYQKRPKIPIFQPKIVIFEHFQHENKRFPQKIFTAALFFNLKMRIFKKIRRGDQGNFEAIHSSIQVEEKHHKNCPSFKWSVPSLLYMYTYK
jgi:hypothetical protein